MTSLSLRLRSVLISEKFTDCSFVTADGTLIHGHRIVLAAASPVFEAMFYGAFSKRDPSDPSSPSSSNPDTPVRISDISGKIFRAMMDLVYTDTLDWSTLSNYDLLELYYCLEKYMLCKWDFFQQMHSRLNCNSLFLFYDFAIRFRGSAELQQLLANCRRLLRELLEKKPHLFFKKVLQVNCDSVIRDYEEVEGLSSSEDESGPAVKRRPPVPIEFIEDIVFGKEADRDPIGQYHQVSKECLNDILVLNYDDANGTFNENLLLFVLKWTKIEWKLERRGGERLALQKTHLHNYYKDFLCHKRLLPLVENLMSFLDNHYYLNSIEDLSGWYSVQRLAIKACAPLTLKRPEEASDVFVTKFRVNHRIAIKSFVINSRQNNQLRNNRLAVVTAAVGGGPLAVYAEKMTLEILAHDIETRDAVRIHRQQFNSDVEFNSQFEFFLNKCLYFYPNKCYSLRVSWPSGSSALPLEYPRRVYERAQQQVINGKQVSVVFMDDRDSDNNERATGDSLSPSNPGDNLLSGSILAGLQFMFVS